MPVLRTPDECFADLPLWDYEPSYFVSKLYDMEVGHDAAVLRSLAVPRPCIVAHLLTNSSLRAIPGTYGVLRGRQSGG
jgi:hypothetical protein